MGGSANPMVSSAYCLLKLPLEAFLESDNKTQRECQANVDPRQSATACTLRSSSRYHYLLISLNFFWSQQMACTGHERWVLLCYGVWTWLQENIRVPKQFPNKAHPINYNLVRISTRKITSQRSYYLSLAALTWRSWRAGNLFSLSLSSIAFEHPANKLPVTLRSRRSGSFELCGWRLTARSTMPN